MAAKKHMEIPEGEWDFLRQRNGDTHITACKKGYIAPRGETPRWLEIHHILCVHACSDKTFPLQSSDDQKKFIRSCLAITTWDINAEPNVIGLPTKWAYVKDLALPGKPAAWDGLPCHQVDHDLYLKSVNVFVTDKIWKKIRKAEKGKECEELTPENIAKKFETGSDVWRSFLEARGKYYGGTKACIDYCLRGTPDPLGVINDNNWHIPFSMAPNKAEVRKRIKPESKGTLEREALLAAIK
jgi:hypothetical protein